MASRARTPTLLFVAYAATLLIPLLAPLDFYTRNAARWSAHDRALDFPAAGVVRSVTPPRRLHRDVTSGPGFALEVWLSSRKRHQTGPARIVSYSADTRARNFTLGQQGRSLVMRLRTTETDLNGIPSLEVPDVFAVDARRHVVVTYDAHVLCAYVDGRREACRTSPQGRLVNWDASHHLLLGNETTANRPWLGRLFLVALYDRPLSASEIEAAYTAAGRSLPTGPAAADGVVALYAFGEGSDEIVRDSTPRDPIHLAIPGIVEQRRLRFLSRASTLAHGTVWAAADVALNVLMFVPFGVLCYVALRSRGWAARASTTIALAIAATFSVGVESVQYFLISRASQLEDVALNLFGAGIGVVVASASRRLRPRRTPQDTR